MGCTHWHHARDMYRPAWITSTNLPVPLPVSPAPIPSSARLPLLNCLCVPNSNMRVCLQHANYALFATHMLPLFWVAPFLTVNLCVLRCSTVALHVQMCPRPHAHVHDMQGQTWATRQAFAPAPFLEPSLCSMNGVKSNRLF